MLLFKLFKKYVLVFALVTVSASALSENLIRPFVLGSFAQILEHRQDKSFVIVLWSLDCPSCYTELEMLGGFNKQYSDIDIVLISTDITATEDELKMILTKYKLNNIESWKFSGDIDEQLRYEIDKSWYGELPRSYIFNKSGKIHVVSGALSKEKLIELF